MSHSGTHNDVTEPDFEQLVDAHYAALYRFALSLAKNEMDAADLTQQTFYIWAEKGRDLRDPGKAKSWLFTTLYREFLGGRGHERRFPKDLLWGTPEEAAEKPLASHTRHAAPAMWAAREG